MPIASSKQPKAKINLGLRILERLPNGYHRLETLMYPLDAPADRLVITAHAEDACQLQMTGRPIDGDLANNLVVRAWQALKEVYPAVLGVKIDLAKRIPAGAGLGGGSADAAATLAGLNDLFELGASTEALATIGAKLGSDIPFFLYQKFI